MLASGSCSVRSIDNGADLMRHLARELPPASDLRRSMLCAAIPARDLVVAPQGAQHVSGLKRMAANFATENGEIVVRGGGRGALRSGLPGQIDALGEAIGAGDRQGACERRSRRTRGPSC